MQETSPARYHDAWRSVVVANGILVPGGFGQRGSDGMMLAIKYARESKVPFLGICFGFQLAVVEWAKNVLNLPGEFFFFFFCVHSLVRGWVLTNALQVPRPASLTQRRNIPSLSSCPKFHGRIWAVRCVSGLGLPFLKRGARLGRKPGHCTAVVVRFGRGIDTGTK